jgi:hypothetical protein
MRLTNDIVLELKLTGLLKTGLLNVGGPYSVQCEEPSVIKQRKYPIICSRKKLMILRNDQGGVV